jgi:hypothetical protein
VAEFDVEITKPADAQGVRRKGDHLHVRFFPRGPDELHAALGDLASAAAGGLVGAEHRLAVIQPLRQRHGAEARRRHPGDRRRAVRPHDQNLPASFNALEHALLRQRIAESTNRS